MSSLVLKAIRSADIERLQKTLEAVVADAHGRTIVEKELLAPADNDALIVKPTRQALATAAKRIRYETCIQCDEEFDVMINKENECSWHSGECEVDWEHDVWCDTDEAIHGPIDTEENREEFPDGFIWSCCGGQADADGCKTGVHKPAKSSRKRSRA